MKVECVHCGASGQMDESKVPSGAISLKCPRCGKNFPIPTRIESSAEAQTKAEVVKEEVVRQGASSLAATQRPVRTEPSPSASAEDMAQCTVCTSRFPKDEMVRFGASWVCAACKPGYVQMLAQGKPRPGEMRFAGFGIRLGAKMLDGLILGLVSFLFTLALGFALPKSSPRLVIASGLLSFILNSAVGAAYSGYFLNKNQATPGKMACGLAVVSPRGGRISFMRGVGRYFAELLSSATLGIGYLMVMFDAEKRSLHDRVCDTRVIYK